MLEFASTSTLSLSVLHSLTLHLGLVESDGLPDLGEAGGHQVDCGGLSQWDRLILWGSSQGDRLILWWSSHWDRPSSKTGERG